MSELENRAMTRFFVFGRLNGDKRLNVFWHYADKERVPSRPRRKHQEEIPMRLPITILMITALSGCESVLSPLNLSAEDTQPHHNVYQAGMPDNQVSRQDPLRTYLHELVVKLTDNMRDLTTENTLAVTSFVYLNSDLQSADLLGQHMAEHLGSLFHEFGANVIDVKTLDFVRVTEFGDFSFSRDFTELRHDLPIDYVLGGTLVNTGNGMVIHSKVIDIKTKQVTASASIQVPSHLVEELQVGAWVDGIPGVAR